MEHKPLNDSLVKVSQSMNALKPAIRVNSSLINNISIDVWFVMMGQYLKGCKSNLNIEKIIFKVVQIKFLAMHINNQKYSFDIFTVQISSWNMILIS